LKTRKRDGTPLFTKTYGKFEFRAKVPWGKGMWPALWMLPQDDKYGGWAASGEIDVMEIFGEKPDQTLGTIHFGSGFPARELVTHVYDLPGGSTVSDWHVYSVEWEPGEIRWLLDGVLWATQTFWWSCSKKVDDSGVVAKRKADINPWPAPFDQPFYLVMNVAVGGNFPGHPNPETKFPAEMVVDFVRVYDKVGGYGDARPIGRGHLPYQKKD
jgi:beta-glucanase (GH16 family)